MRIEIAFFLGGTTRTAWDQSISSGAASGSPRTAAAISSSVKDATCAQSVLLFRETTVIFLAFISARSLYRYPSVTVFFATSSLKLVGRFGPWHLHCASDGLY